MRTECTGCFIFLSQQLWSILHVFFLACISSSTNNSPLPHQLWHLLEGIKRHDTDALLVRNMSHMHPLLHAARKSIQPRIDLLIVMKIYPRKINPTQNLQKFSRKGPAFFFLENRKGHANWVRRIEVGPRITFCSMLGRDSLPVALCLIHFSMQPTVKVSRPKLKSTL